MTSINSHIPAPAGPDGGEREKRHAGRPVKDGPKRRAEGAPTTSHLDLLRRTEKGIRISPREVVFDHAVLTQKSLGIFF